MNNVIYLGSDVTLNITLEDPTSNPLNLTGATVTVSLQPVGGNVPTTVQATIVSALDGTVSAVLTPSVITQSGQWEYQCAVVNGSTTNLSGIGMLDVVQSIA